MDRRLCMMLRPYYVVRIGQLVRDVELPGSDYHSNEAAGVYEVSFEWEPVLHKLVAEERYRRRAVPRPQAGEAGKLARGRKRKWGPNVSKAEMPELQGARREVEVKVRYAWLRKWEEQHGATGLAHPAFDGDAKRDCFAEPYRTLEAKEVWLSLENPPYDQWTEWSWPVDPYVEPEVEQKDE
jgi:hypothetical protein